MTPDELAGIGRGLYGERWQRPLARALDAAGVEGLALDPDGRRMRRWASEHFRIPAGAATVLRALAAAARTRPAIEQRIALVRRTHPRASLAYAQILLRLERAGARGVSLPDLCIDYGDDPNSSTINQACRQLELLGLVRIDRGAARNEGNQVYATPAPAER